MGETVRWRVINPSVAVHPMHLHGFFFTVNSRGDLQRDTTYWEGQRRQAVTERMDPGTTMSLEWTPDRPGGWSFHCHISGHVGPNHRPLDRPVTNQDVQERRAPQILGNPEHDPEHHVEQGMGGLMMGMYINPSPEWTPDDRPRRQMSLIINSDSVSAPTGTALERQGPHRRSFSPILREGTTDPAPDSVRLPGSTLVMKVGEPTSVWVVNRSPEPTQMHWHGLKIESPFDGVVGVGGYGGMPSRTRPGRGVGSRA